MFKRILTIALLALSCVSCQMFASLLHDDYVVARIGHKRLYASEVKAYIPVGISTEDSLSLAGKYIRNWADELLFNKMAQRQLTNAEQDVKGEIEAYRRSLLRYRYEQRYISERLDTVVTAVQIEDYYLANRDHFLLERPVLKVRFLDIMKDSPNLALLKEKMSSDENDDLEEADSLAYNSAFRYFDNSDRWMDAAVLAREFDTSHDIMLSKLRNKFITMEMEGDAGEIRLAYVCEMVPSGSPAPVEYCRDEIRSIIIHNRKKELIADLEQDLLDQALKNKKLVIYQD